MNRLILNEKLVITYKKNGNIKTCKSFYENTECFKPLKEKVKRFASSYIPLVQSDINTWFKNNC